MKAIKILIITLFSLSISFGYSQKKEKVDEKTKHYFKDFSIEKDNYNVTINKGVSRFDLLKFGIKIENKTSDYLIWDNSNSKISFDWGEKSPEKPKTIKIKPNKSRISTFQVNGGSQMLVSSFTFLQSGLSRIPIDGQVQKIVDFKLPESKNSIKSSDFTITLKKAKKKTDETFAKFEVVYSGDRVAVVKLNNISVRVNENDIFANDNKKPTPYILTKGEKMNFTVKFHIERKVVDMQFADMFIQWNDAFSLSDIIPISGIEAKIVLDEELTKEKK